MILAEIHGWKERTKVEEVTRAENLQNKSATKIFQPHSTPHGQRQK